MISLHTILWVFTYIITLSRARDASPAHCHTHAPSPTIWCDLHFLCAGIWWGVVRARYIASSLMEQVKGVYYYYYTSSQHQRTRAKNMYKKKKRLVLLGCCCCSCCSLTTKGGSGGLVYSSGGRSCGWPCHRAKASDLNAIRSSSSSLLLDEMVMVLSFLWCCVMQCSCCC